MSWARLRLGRSIIVLSGLFTFAGLTAAIGAETVDRAETVYRKLTVLAEIISHVERHYVDEQSPEQLIYGAARGVVATLDEHSSFLGRKEYQGLLDENRGEYVGVGLTLHRMAGSVQIKNTIPRSPAAVAGLLPGDIIVSVDESDVLELTLGEIERRIRGAPGTKTTLETRRDGSGKTWRFSLERAWVRLSPVIHSVLAGAIHHVRVATFSDRTSVELEAALTDKVGRAGAAPKGIILDLRGNPGGLFEEAVEVCDLFLSGGPVVTVVTQGNLTPIIREARTRQILEGVPFALLIDGGSASASEIVAGALKDRKRARLFGSETFGKGSVQTVFELSDGSGIKLTTARYMTPSGRPIDHVGVKPHVGTPEQADRDATLEAALRWLRRKR